MNKDPHGRYLRYSIWLTALIMVILVVLLALTVYYARERAIIELFSQQQASIAEQKASRIKATIATCENGLVMLARLISTTGTAPVNTGELLKSFYGELPGIVLSAAFIGEDDAVRIEYAGHAPAGIMGERIDDEAVLHAMKKMRQRYVGEMLLAERGTGKPVKVVAVGVPILGEGGGYRGALLAVLDAGSLIGRRKAPGLEDPGDFWIVDESGIVVFHPDPAVTGRPMDELSPAGTSPFRSFAYRDQRYTDLVLETDGSARTCIAAYAPVRIGIAQWWVVLVTPHERVLGPVRRASLNILLGALGLIAVVIVTAVSITRSDVKRMRLKEELKRLKEREEW
ncbi:MAG TPA: cache domain-containing protein, partial [Deltaproteobacteria bacterium]|nr:cache domain-containing protein [Deltaproteobacteria bacterium]